jgi:hypothetical protein
MDLLEPSKNAVICAFNKLVELDEQGVKNYVFSDEVPKEAKADADTIIEKILIDNPFVITALRNDYGSAEDSHLILDHLISAYLMRLVKK